MNYKIVKIIALVLGIESYLLIAGWVFGINIIGTILPNATNTRFPIALGFFLSSFVLYFMARSMQKGDKPARRMLTWLAIFIFLTMLLLFISHLSGITTSLEKVFVRDSSPFSLFGSGVPSVLSITNLVLFGLAAMYAFQGGKWHRLWLKVFGFIIIATSAIQLLSNALSIPTGFLPYNPDKIYMASICFILLGLALIILGETKKS